MDWIDEKIKYLKDKLKITSLKKSLGIYILIAILAVIAAYITTIVFCEGWRTLIYQEYSNTKSIMYNSEGTLTVEVQGIDPADATGVNSLDSKLIFIIDLIEKGSILLYSVIAIGFTSHIFYRNRLEEPINILIEEAQYISRNDLSFECRYESGDEMGEICSAFDKMRVQLSKNQESMWNMMEEQRRLNAAFAHDLRTPLTVMQGYTELLTKYYPKGMVSEEKLLDTLKLLEYQVNRLKKFSETMKDIHTFEGIKIKKGKNKLIYLLESIRRIANGLKGPENIIMDIQNNLSIDEAYYDDHIILEVLENLLSNALSYSNSHIDIFLENEGDMLHLYVRDDGKGFAKEELFMATSPYYSSRADSNEHFGIGLTICKLLCEKHGGSLSISNSTRGGAIVCASFFIM